MKAAAALAGYLMPPPNLALPQRSLSLLQLRAGDLIAVRNSGAQRASYEIWLASSKAAKAFLQFELEAPKD